MRSPQNNDATLTSLAYINVTWEDSRTSYLDNFVPFTLEVLRTADEPLTEHEVTRHIRDRFGLDLPAGVVGSLVGRAVRKRKAVRRSGKVTLADGVAATLPDVAAEQAGCRRQQNHLVVGLLSFAASRFNLTWEEADAESALVEYIEAHAAPLLARTVFGRHDSDAAGGVQRREYVVAAYISEIIENEPAAFDYLEQMVKGSMLAAALYVEAPGDVRRRFKKTTLYLDTAICLRALGHEGPEAKLATQKVLALAAAQGAQLACFEHSVREMRGVLESAKAQIRAAPGAETAMRGVATFFRASGYTASDVDLAVQRLERDLEASRISVLPTPAYIAAHTVDETSLEDLLQQRVGYWNDGARLADLKSLTAIHRLRRGESGPYLETCGAVLVTNNGSLVRGSREFFNAGRHEWPVAMLDHDLAALVWVKEPTTAPDLPRRQVIADCVSALSPSASLWTKFVNEIDRLDRKGGVTKEDVTLLRYSHEAERAVLDATFGDPRRIDETTILKALAQARDAAAAPAEATRDAAIERAVVAESAQVANAFELAQSAQENLALKQRMEALEVRNAQQEVAIRRRVDGRVRHLDTILTGVLAAILVGSTLFGVLSLFPGVSQHMNAAVNWTLRVCAVLIAVAGGVILYHGKSIREWKANQVENLRIQRVRRALSDAGLIVEAEA
jgi:hypothetical protein